MMENTIHDLVTTQEQLRILLDVVIAMFLGGVIGVERELKDKPAGFRTFMIIAAAAALFVALGRFGVLFYADIIPETIMRSDPIRIFHAVIVGVGFIGAGVIIKRADGEEVHYLTTAATIWISAAIGIAVALKFYVLAISITIVMLIINSLFDKIDGWLIKRRRIKENGKND